MGKAIVGILVVVILAVAGGAYFVLQNIDGIVKDLIEEAGTESVGTAVRVAEVKVDLAEGTALISGMTVANPEGFSPEPLLTLASIKVSIDTSSLTKGVYVINDVAVDGVRVLAEQKGTGTNVQALVDGMPEDAAAEGDGSASAADDTLLAVGQINVAAGQIELRSEQLGAREFELSAIRMSNLGSADKGMTTDELSDEISDRLLGQIKAAVTSAISDYLRDEAKDRIKERLGEKLGDLFKR